MRRIVIILAAAIAPALAAWPAGDAVPQRAADHDKARARARYWQARRALLGLARVRASSRPLRGFASRIRRHKRRSVRWIAKERLPCLACAGSSQG